MADEHLMDNPRSERVKKVAALASAKGRRRQGMFMAEGPQPVREALKLWLAQYEDDDGEALSAAALPRLDALFFTAEALERHPDIQALVDRLRAVLFEPDAELPRGARIFLREATDEVLEAMSDADSPQGMLAVARIPETHGDDAGLAAHTSGDESARTQIPQAASLVTGLVRIQDPGNVGTIIRTSDAAGADLVMLTFGSADPWAPKVVRSAAGSHFHMPIFTGIDAAGYTQLAQSHGLQVLAAAGQAEKELTDLTAATSQATDAVTARAKTLWLFGNEAQGLEEEEVQRTDAAVSIPLYGQAESLNVATAASICLYTTAMAQRVSA